MPRAAACQNGSLWEVVVSIRISIMKEKRCDETAMRKGCANVLRLSFRSPKLQVEFFLVGVVQGETRHPDRGDARHPDILAVSAHVFLLKLMDSCRRRPRRADLLHQFCIWSRLWSDDRLCARAVGVFCVGRAPV